MRSPGSRFMVVLAVGLAFGCGMLAEKLVLDGYRQVIAPLAILGAIALILMVLALADDNLDDARTDERLAEMKLAKARERREALERFGKHS